MSETTELQRAVEALTGELKSLRAELVRKDVYAADQSRRDDQIDSIRTELAAIRTTAEKLEERRAQDRRLIIASFVAPLLLLLLNLYIASQTGSA